LISLQTATELITIFLVFNKLTGAYGLLAILTGYSLSALQLLTYIYSIAVLGLLFYLLRHIRRQTPLECLALAWLYVVDSIVNAGCTAAFAVMWFRRSDPRTAKPPATTAAPDGVEPPHIGPVDTIASLVFIVLFTTVRAYLSLVVMSYAQQVLQLASAPDHGKEQRGEAQQLASPFAAGAPEGDGWRGRLGRLLVSVGRGYWLERQEDEAWAQDMHAKFRTSRSAPAATADASGS